MEQKLELVYVTVDDVDIAQNIAKSLVIERLAACVNIIDKVRSFYVWENKMHDKNEVVLLCKSTIQKMSLLKERIIELHPYSVPCILSTPVVCLNQEFFQWVVEYTKSSDISAKIMH